MSMNDLSTKTINAVLRRVKKIVEAGWTRRTWARDKWGHEVFSDSPAACRFCIAAAVTRAARRNTWQVRDAVIRKLERALGPKGFAGIIAFNDSPGRKKSEVLALIDRALKLKS